MMTTTVRYMQTFVMINAPVSSKQSRPFNCQLSCQGIARYATIKDPLYCQFVMPELELKLTQDHAQQLISQLELERLYRHPDSWPTGPSSCLASSCDLRAVVWTFTASPSAT